jgi:DNA-binding Xre family transcriptional regulator
MANKKTPKTVLEQVLPHLKKRMEKMNPKKVDDRNGGINLFQMANKESPHYVGLSYPTLHDLFSGKKDSIYTHRLEKICEVLGLKLDVILSEKNKA